MKPALFGPHCFPGSSGMKRSDVIREIVLCEGLIISNLGFPSRELYALADEPRNFYMLGSMGLVSSLGLGLALSQDERVYVIDGDGSLLMNLGSLATIGNQAPPNFCLVVVDNKVYASTGNQSTYSGGHTDLAAVARGAGNEHVVRVTTIDGLQKALQEFRSVSAVIIAEAEPGNEKVPVIPYASVAIKNRFMEAVKRLKIVH